MLSYAEHTQGRALAHVNTLSVERGSELIELPPTTHRNLELTETLRGEASPTLLSLIDTCRTGMGSRALRHWLTHPLRDRAQALARHGAIAQMLADGVEPLRELLRGVSDVERISARIALRQVRPRELSGLRQTLAELPRLRAVAPRGSALLDSLHAELAPPPAVGELLARAIAAEPAVLLRDGGVIATGFDAELDELRAIGQNCDDFLLALEARERERTGIANLRVQFNKVHGFYIEVTSSGRDKVPADYQRRQTLKNAERFITPELKAFEDKALSAQDRALAREKWLFELLLDELQGFLGPLTALGRALAALDALAALTERAATLDWCAPEFVNHPCIEIQAGRHPVVQARLAETGAGDFIANDCRLDARTRLQIITGPNMGGKSTYMRQVALIVLLASMGSYVPARFCRLGPIDAIHTRIGAADDLANAQSTFMMEMTEAAAILHSATEHSLVLMDEIGRGTSTFDGLALASAIATQLHDRCKAFTLFATHYFELTEFPRRHERAVNLHVSAAESGDDIVFLHAIEPGPASRSYGVQVARLAGMPPALIRQARATLEALESQAQAREAQVDLFAPPPTPTAPVPSELEEALGAIDPDALTPARPWTRSTISRNCRKPTHDLLRRHPAQRRPGVPVRLPYQRGRGRDQHLPQDDRLRKAGRPLHGADVGRQSEHLAVGAGDPAGREAAQWRRRADHHLERQEHVRRHPGAGRGRAPRLRAGRPFAEGRRHRLQLQHDLRWPDRRRGHAPVPGLFGWQLHRSHPRDLLLPDRREQVRQAHPGPRAHPAHTAGRGRQMRLGVHGFDAQVQPLGGPAAGPAGLRGRPAQE